MCFLHGSEIAGTAAILFLIRAQRLPAAFAPQGLFLQRRMVVRPPLDTAGVAAKPTLRAGSPFRLKVFSSFRAFVDWHVRAVPLCIVVSHLAFTAAEFLPRDMQVGTKPFPQFKQASSFAMKPSPRVFLPSYHTGKGSELFDAYLWASRVSRQSGERNVNAF